MWDGEMIMRKYIAAAGVAGLAMFAGTSANAALLSIIGGGDLAVPAANDVVGQPNNIGSIGDTIHPGALLQAEGGSTLTYHFTGAEAKFLDTLITPGGSLGNQPNSLVDLPGALFATVAQASTGFAEFSFTIDTNKDGTPEYTIVNEQGGNSNQFRSFALAYLDDLYNITQQATNRVGIFLDDSGANADSDFDDWVGYVEASSVQPVPLPAAIPLFLAGLAGLGLIGQRRKQA